MDDFYRGPSAANLLLYIVIMNKYPVSLRTKLYTPIYRFSRCLHVLFSTTYFYTFLLTNTLLVMVVYESELTAAHVFLFMSAVVFFLHGAHGLVHIVNDYTFLKAINSSLLLLIALYTCRTFFELFISPFIFG